MEIIKYYVHKNKCIISKVIRTPLAIWTDMRCFSNKLWTFDSIVLIIDLSDHYYGPSSKHVDRVT